MSTTTKTEIKIAKFIHENLPTLVIKAGTHPLFCKLNLHNSGLLKKLNARANIIYKMSSCEDVLVKAPYNLNGESDIDNALLSIKALLQSDYHGEYKDYIFKRIGFLVDEALRAYYDVSHQSWVQRIHNAIHAAKKEIAVKTKDKKSAIKKKQLIKVKPTKAKKPIKRARNSKGQFIKARKRR